MKIATCRGDHWSSADVQCTPLHFVDKSYAINIEVEKRVLSSGTMARTACFCYAFGIQLKYHYDVRFTFRAALRRSWLVFRYGLGWNLPSYNIYRLGKSYLECEEYPDMLWDDETDVTYRMWTHTDLSGIFACVCLIFLLSNVVYDDILLPKYRDTVTISEFSEK